MHGVLGWRTSLFKQCIPNQIKDPVSGPKCKKEAAVYRNRFIQISTSHSSVVRRSISLSFNALEAVISSWLDDRIESCSFTRIDSVGGVASVRCVLSLLDFSLDFDARLSRSDLLNIAMTTLGFT